MKIKFIGFTVINIKNGNYVDYDGDEYEDGFETWKTIKDAKEILDDIDWWINNRNNKHTRKLKRNRKFFKVVKMSNKFTLV